MTPVLFKPDLLPGEAWSGCQTRSMYISEQVLLLMEGQDGLTHGIVGLQALVDGRFAVICLVLHPAPACNSLDHGLRGTVEHNDDVGSLAHQGSHKGTG